MRRALLVAAAMAVCAPLTMGNSGCSDADVVSENISTDADYFKIMRRVVFYNGITGQYILEVDGLCSIGNNDPQGKLSITCKVGPSAYKKHFLGLSDNVTFFAEQMDASPEDPYHYNVVFKPETMLPSFKWQTP